jgi:2-keto-4-pentenoate hydratase
MTALLDMIDWFATRRLADDDVADLPAGLKPADEMQAYQVQAGVTERLIGGGRGPQVGWKIGVTTAQMRAHLGIEAPIAGAVLAAGRREPGAGIATADFTRIGIECEIAMVLGQPLGGGAPVNRHDAEAVVAMIHPAIELVDDRYGGDYPAFGVPGIIADFCFHAGFVLGAGVPDWRDLDLALLTGVTRADGVERVRGLGADVQGHPMASLAWLANQLTTIGRRLEPGDIVLTGSLPLPYWAQAGEAIEIDIERLGTVGMTLT